MPHRPQRKVRVLRTDRTASLQSCSESHVAALSGTGYSNKGQLMLELGAEREAWVQANVELRLRLREGCL
eukprot:2194231-Amphidinium_carterae.1